MNVVADYGVSKAVHLHTVLESYNVLLRYSLVLLIVTQIHSVYMYTCVP